MPEEQPLTGGNVTPGVVRVGATVRKPPGPAADSVLAFLGHLEERGFDGAPRQRGRDEAGRLVVEYVDGPVAHDLPLLGADGLQRVGRLVRELHDAAESFVPPPGAVWDVVIAPDEERLVCHHDLAPWNLVLGADRWVFIDWDNCGPGSRLWDLAYAAHGFVGMARGNDPCRDGRRLAALVGDYGLSREDRGRLVALLPRRLRSMQQLLERGGRTGEEPWARLHAEGHTAHWAGAADYAEASAELFAEMLAP